MSERSRTGPAVVPVIMAGGAGTRFWPASREARPKQLLDLFGGGPLVEQTVRRLSPLAAVERLLIVTTRGIVEAVHEAVPHVPRANLLAEPAGRNTAAAIGLAAIVARASWPTAVLAVMPADHYIADEEAFVRLSRSAIRHAADGHIVTLGITPTRPETGYGYIRFADFVPEAGGEPPEHPARRIAAFVEKPDMDTALRYLKEGRYLWNAGMFFVRVDVILEEIGLHLPELSAGLDRIAEAVGTPGFEAEVDRVYPSLASVSIDHGVMERSDRIVVLPASMGWSDVGSWNVLSDFRDEDRDNLEVGRVIAFDAADNVLYADEGRIVAALGVRDLVVAASGNAVLVCPKSRAQDVRRVVDEVRRRGWIEEL